MTIYSRLVDVSRQAVLAERLEKAGTFRKQLVGLIGRRDLPEGSGLWLPGCNAIHTFGVRFPIDVAFVDSDWRVIRLFHSVAPCRIRLSLRGTRHTIELPEGALKRSQVREGDLLRVESLRA